MAAEAKGKPGALKRWLQKRRDGWRRSGAMADRARGTRRADNENAERRRPGSGDAGPFVGGI